MIRIAIIILALLIGCAKPPKPEPRFVGQYLSLDGETFKTDYPNLKELGRSYHSNYVKYLMSDMFDSKILMARYDDKKGAWNITVRRPHPKEVEFHMSKGEWTID